MSLLLYKKVNLSLLEAINSWLYERANRILFKLYDPKLKGKIIHNVSGVLSYSHTHISYKKYINKQINANPCFDDLSCRF